MQKYKYRMGSWKGLANNYRGFSLFILMAGIMNFLAIVTDGGLIYIVYPFFAYIGFPMVLVLKDYKGRINYA